MDLNNLKKVGDFVIGMGADCKFRIESGPGVDHEKDYDATGFPSMQQAVEWCKRRIKAAIAERETQLALPVLSGDGEQIAVRGFNSNTGEVLTTPVGKVTNGNMYPVVAWIEELLKERKKLSDRIAEINARIHPFVIRPKSSYGRLSPEVYEAKVASLLEQHEKMTKAAEEKA